MRVARLNGNEIREHDLKRGTTSTLARPESNYLCYPRYDDKGAPFFLLCAATNGESGGSVGVGAPDGAGGVKTLLAPQKSHGLYHLVNKVVIRDGSPLVWRARPLTSGEHVADAYMHELIDAADGTVLYTWGTPVRGEGMHMDVRMCPSGLQIGHDGWAQLGPRPLVKTPKSPAANLSPDCSSLVSCEGQRLTVKPVQGGTPRVWRVASRYISFQAWSPDSTHMVLVLGTEEDGEKFGYDEIVVLRVADMPLAHKRGKTKK